MRGQLNENLINKGVNNLPQAKIKAAFAAQVLDTAISQKVKEKYQTPFSKLNTFFSALLGSAAALVLMAYIGRYAFSKPAIYAKKLQRHRVISYYKPRHKLPCLIKATQQIECKDKKHNDSL